MKRYIVSKLIQTFCYAALLILGASSILQAQHKLTGGLKVGPNLGIFRYAGNNTTTLDFGAKVAMGGGIHAAYKLADRFRLQAEMLYMRNAGIAIFDQYLPNFVVNVDGLPVSVDARVRINGKLDMQYLTLPLLAGYDVLHAEKYSIAVMGGPTLYYNLNSNVTGNYEVNVSRILALVVNNDVWESLNAQGINNSTELVVEKGRVQNGVFDFNSIDYGFLVGTSTRLHTNFGNLLVDVRYLMNFQDMDRGPDKLFTGGFHMAFGWEL
jgi:hypothetical protein